jgi:large subunit ribosomal protein L6
MARLGKKPVLIQDGVKISKKDGRLIFEGGKGKTEQEIFPNLDVSVNTDRITISNTINPKDRKLYRKTEALQGLLRKLVLNKIKGVKDGFEKILELHGVGYKVEVQGRKMILSIGFSNPVERNIPEGIEVEIHRNTIIFIRGMEKQKVGNYAAEIRAICPPEPYKGKGIRYRGEYVRHKAGKTSVGATQ